ncbi:MAG: glutathione S-transferase family protein [Gammaproteobacteria bacterium]|nr:glutathione S-transferase family protein [Gammaproteobacteria bacterium]MDH5800934.1 glutathione S-transferase family protein [Gammaproteobacteria bacterium]
MPHTNADGEFIRWESAFRSWITPDGQAGPSGQAGFAAEPNRYHLFVSYACPWAHRTLIYRRLKKLEEFISVSVVSPDMGPESWHFDPTFPGSTVDHIYNSKFLYEVYRKVRPDFDGVVTVPVLWDKKQNTIVNNESSEIIRMLNSAFNEFTDVKTDYYPEALRTEIDAINHVVYDHINNGVYRCGFATSQQAYEKAFDSLFSTLDDLEQRLSQQRFLAGGQITEADWRLLPTLLRFDPVYVGHFKCNLRRIADFPNLCNYTRDLYQHPGVAETFELNHVKRHYYFSHESINPTRIVPKGPELDYMAPHDRERFS